MQFKTLPWLGALPSLLRSRQPAVFELMGRSLSDLTDTELEQFIAQCNAKYAEERAAAVQKAHAAAASGEGPQRFDEDWIETGWDVEESIGEALSNWSWWQVQVLSSLVDMALASPQGQRALAERSEESGVRLWRDHLEMIHDLRVAISGRSYGLLYEQAKGLGLPEEATDRLLEAGEEHRRALQAEYREFVGPA